MRLHGKVMLDASPLRSRHTGIGYYTAQLIAGLRQAGIGDQLLMHDFGLGQRHISGAVREITKHAIGNKHYLRLREHLFRRHYSKARSDNGPLIYHATNNIAPLDLNVPLLTTVHDLSVLHFPQHHPEYRVHFYRQYFSRTLNSAKIITISHSTRRDLLEHFPQLEARTTTVYPAHNDFYGPQPKGCGLATVRCYTQKPFLLCIGSIEPRKNIENLLRAYQIIRSKHDVALLLAGGLAWKYKPVLRLREQLRLHDVIFTGYLPESELRDLYNEAELFVFPSLYEGFGFPPLEAMACGTPVAMSQSTSLPEVGGAAACYFNPHSPEDIANTIGILLSQSELRAKMSIAGLQQAQNFSWNKAARRMIEIYTTTLGEL